MWPAHSDTLVVMDNLAACLHSLKRPEEATKVMGEILGLENQPRAGSGGAQQQFNTVSMTRLARACAMQGRYEGALILNLSIASTIRIAKGVC